MSNRIVVAIFMLFLVLMISLYLGSQNYNGFALTKSSLSEYPYEGFAVYQEAFDKREGAANMGEKNKKMTPDMIKKIKVSHGKPRFTDPSDNLIVLPQGNGFGVIDDLFGKQGFDTLIGSKPAILAGTPFQTTPSKEGFETLTGSKPDKLGGSSYVAEQKPVAFLYNNDANTTCKNYGYTNSKGFICMSSSDIQLLTTRGGNAAGVSDQIGK